MFQLRQLRSELRTKVRFRAVETMLYAADVAKSSLSTGPGRRLRVLFVSDNTVYTSEQQFAPLLALREAVRHRLGVAIHYQLTADVLKWPRLALGQYALVCLKLGFRNSGAEAVDKVKRLRAKLRPQAKLIYFDGDDDLSIQWPEVLPLVDLYVKKHCFKNRAEYTVGRIGKSNLTDYVSRNHGISFANDIIPASRPVPEAELHKIVVGWNVGLDDKIRRLYRELGRSGLEHPKDLDVVSRATVSHSTWIYPLRATIIDRVGALASEFKVLTPDRSVPQAEYYEEMRRSRICVSPFGYGEICWRDFEAILCGALIVKPDMSHVETEPDVFRANETYVPVKWDYSDLESAIRGILADPARWDRIRRAAFEVLERYYDAQAVVGSFDRIIRRVIPSTVDTDPVTRANV